LVQFLVRQSDGRLISCEAVDDSGASPSVIRRLEADGTVDLSFSPVTTALRVGVGMMLVQPDGKVLVGGAFERVNGTPRYSLARLDTNGSLDEAFQPVLSQESVVIEAIVLQPDGKILVGGNFATIGGVMRSDVARLNSDGSIDPAFDTSTRPRRHVLALAQQSDGKVVVGGIFGQYDTNGLTIVRLCADGSLDPTFSSGSGAGIYGRVRAMSVLSDGDLLIGGQFDSVNGLPQRSMARLHGGVARPVLQPPARLANGDLRITAVGMEVGRAYALEASTNLLDWVRLDTPVATSNVFHFIDSTAHTLRKRFYRARPVE
jgi:uncharacterized delta-60 repeat protein